MCSKDGLSYSIATCDAKQFTYTKYKDDKCKKLAKKSSSDTMKNFNVKFGECTKIGGKYVKMYEEKGKQPSSTGGTPKTNNGGKSPPKK